MNTKQWFLYLSLSAILISVLFWSSDSLSPSGASSSPLPTPPLPTPTPVPVPKCHALAIAHVAREHGIPQDQLLAGSCFLNANKRWVCDGREEWFEFALIQQKACAVRVWVKDRDESYSVAVSEQGQIVDLAALRAQEHAAGSVQCGKLDPMLCARWSAVADDEEVEVALWLASPDIMAIFDAVAAGYPPPLQPVPGAAFDIGHADYEIALSEVEELMRKAYLEKAEPVVSSLKAMGARDVGTIAAAPIVFASLSKQAISDLSARDDISTIYLLEGQFENAMDSVAGTIRVSPFWSAGDTGSGICVAVVEEDPIDFGNPYLDHADGGTGPTEFEYYYDDPEHATWVAGVIAMKDHPIYQGVAPDVTLISADAGSYASPGGERRIITATNWALNAPNYADIVNCSFGGNPGLYDLLARYYDYVVFWLRRTVVPAAGNTGQYVQSPATAYNVISVGGFDGKDSPDWSDDEMWGSSSYVGPGAREKPEVVAVSYPMCTTSYDEPSDITCEALGTSVAARQVSGLAALLMQETGLLRQPELIKAVIMASAAHNIEGTTPVSSQDGVGGIDAAMAKALVDHGRYGVAPDGWYDYRTVYGYSFDTNGYLHYYVPLSRGEKIRIALAYDSHPDITDPWNTDLLDSDLDLYVYRGTSMVAASSSTANNFEFIEYTATETGTYDVRVKKWSWNGDYEYIGIAWVKMATYLPDVKSSYNDWDSVIILHNDSNETANLDIAFYDRHDDQHSWSTITLPPNYTYSQNLITENFSGSATVGASEDVSVVVVTYHADTPYAVGGYLGISDPAPALYLPLLQRNNWNVSSHIHVMNPGPANAVFQVHYQAEPGLGSGCSTGGYFLSPGSSVAINLRDNPGCSMSSTFVGSARITSDQPLAATATQWQLSGGNWRMFSAYEAIGQPASPTNTPLLMRANYGFDNSLSIQNASAVATNVSVDYYRRIQDGGSYCGTDSLASLGGYRVGRLFPAPSAGLCPPSLFAGSGHVTNSSSSPLALVVNQARQAQLSSYSIGGSPTSVAVLPLVMRSYSTFGTSSWSTGIHVQNVGTASTVVTAVYYYGAGSVAGTYSTSSLAPNSMENIFPVQTPNDFFGSAVLTSSNGQPIFVEVNQIAGSDPAVDTFFSTTSVNR